MKQLVKYKTADKNLLKCFRSMRSDATNQNKKDAQRRSQIGTTTGKNNPRNIPEIRKPGGGKQSFGD
jgi:hypothetical protein